MMIQWIYRNYRKLIHTHTHRHGALPFTYIDAHSLTHKVVRTWMLRREVKKKATKAFVQINVYVKMMVWNAWKSPMAIIIWVVTAVAAATVASLIESQSKLYSYCTKSKREKKMKMNRETFVRNIELDNFDFIIIIVCTAYLWSHYFLLSYLDRRLLFKWISMCFCQHTTSRLLH